MSSQARSPRKRSLPTAAALKRALHGIDLGRVVRRLSPGETALYAAVVDPQLARRVWLLQIPMLPGPYAGLTLWRLVVIERWLEPEHPSALLAHELVHVRQFHEQGIVRFTFDYNKAFAAGLVTQRSWSKAYRAIPAEVEARREATRWAMQRSEAPRSVV